MSRLIKGQKSVKLWIFSIYSVQIRDFTHTKEISNNFNQVVIICELFIQIFRGFTLVIFLFIIPRWLSLSVIFIESSKCSFCTSYVYKYNPFFPNNLSVLFKMKKKYTNFLFLGGKLHQFNSTFKHKKVLVANTLSL